MALWKLFLTNPSRPKRQTWGLDTKVTRMLRAKARRGSDPHCAQPRANPGEVPGEGEARNPEDQHA